MKNTTDIARVGSGELVSHFMENTEKEKAQAMHLRSELHALLNHARVTFVGIGVDGFIVGLVEKRTMKDKKLIRSWHGKSVEYMHVGKIRAFCG